MSSYLGKGTHPCCHPVSCLILPSPLYSLACSADHAVLGVRCSGLPADGLMSKSESLPEPETQCCSCTTRGFQNLAWPTICSKSSSPMKFSRHAEFFYFKTPCKKPRTVKIISETSLALIATGSSLKNHVLDPETWACTEEQHNFQRLYCSLLSVSLSLFIHSNMCLHLCGQ